MKNKYLVTGAAGFIGAAIARKLIFEGHEVWTIDNLSTGFIENLPEDIHFIEGNCQDKKSIKALRSTRFNTIFHFAGQSSGEISFDDPVYDLRTNTESTLKLINYGLENGCPRFVYASSMSVYGDVPDEPICETNSCKPLTFYGVGKLASEYYLKIYQSKGLQPTSLRIFNVYGPGQNMSNLRQGMVSIFLAQALSEKKIIVKGSNKRFRDFIYIDDVVESVLSISNNLNTIGEVYNVGTGIKTTVESLLISISTILNSSPHIIYKGNTPGDQMGIFPNITKLTSHLNFTPKIDLNTGLTKMIDWAKNNKEINFDK